MGEELQTIWSTLHPSVSEVCSKTKVILILFRNGIPGRILRGMSGGIPGTLTGGIPDEIPEGITKEICWGISGRVSVEIPRRISGGMLEGILEVFFCANLDNILLVICSVIYAGIS